MKKALLVIDLQNDYFEGGALPLCGVESVFGSVLTSVVSTKELIDD